MQPVYFLPNVSPGQIYDPVTENINRKALQAHGLLGIFGDLRGKQDLTISHCTLKARAGCLLAYGAPDKFTNPGSLEWEEGPYWIGWDKDNPPTEAELKRKRQAGGYRLEMEDGTSWLVPIIRRPDDTTELPCDMYYDAAGVLKEPVKEAYREYWDVTAEVVSWFFNDSGILGGDGFSKQKGFDLAVKALGINYRFGHAEQRVTKVVNSENWLTILGFTLDYPRQRLISELSKKNLSPPDTANTTPGSKEDSPTTDPAAQTSGLSL